MKATSHGGLLTQLDDEVDKVNDFIDFSSSINAITPQIPHAFPTHLIQHYPHNDNLGLLHQIAKTFQISENKLILGHGTTALIYQIFQNLRPKNTVLFTPIFSEYQTCAKLFSQQIQEINRHESGWQTQQFPEESLIVFVNPSTPDGKHYELGEVEKLLEQWHRLNCWILIDESFLPFIDLSISASARQWLERFPRLLILQSLTKFYACPGIRAGALFCHSAFQQSFKFPPWNVSAFDQHWLTQALQDQSFFARTQHWLTLEKTPFIDALSKLKVVKNVCPSCVNFLLVELERPADVVKAALFAHKILIRDCENFGLGKHCIRIAVKRSEQNQNLIKALESLC